MATETQKSSPLQRFVKPGPTVYRPKKKVDGQQVVMVEGREIFAERYLVEGPLGFGAFGKVFRAIDTRLGRRVALKMLDDATRVKEDVGVEVVRKAFEHEAQLMASLQHPHIVTLFDYGMSASCYYLAMQYVDGKPLSENGFSLSHVQLIDIFTKLLSALEYMHTRPEPLLHRDIKLENILLDSLGEPHLIDFGLGRFAIPEKSAVSWGDILRGSPDYVAPEWVNYTMSTVMGSARPPQPDGRADLWSLGACLYRLLTRTPPIVEVEVHEILKALREKKPILPPSQVNPAVPKYFDSVVMKFLEYDRENRYPTARDALFALESIRVGAGGATASIPLVTPKDLPVEEFRPSAVTIGLLTEEEEPKKAFPKKAIYVACGLGVCLLALALGGSSKPHTPKADTQHQPQAVAVTSETQNLVLTTSEAPASDKEIEKSLGSVESEKSFMDRVVPHWKESKTKNRKGMAGTVVYRNPQRTRNGRAENAGNEIIVWRRAGVSTGESGGYGVLVGSVVPNVTLLNRIVSYNVESPVRAELRKSLEVNGRTLIPKGSIFLGTAGVVSSIDRVQIVFNRVMTPDRKEIRFKGRALMEDGSQGIVGEVDMRKDVSLAAGAGSAFASTARAATRSTGQLGFGAQFGANMADETLRSAQGDLSNAQRVDRIITVNEFTPIQVYVDETF